MWQNRSTHIFDTTVFIVAFIGLLGFTIDAAYNYGKAHGVASVKPCACKPAALARQQIRAAVFSAAKECRA